MQSLHATLFLYIDLARFFYECEETVCIFNRSCLQTLTNTMAATATSPSQIAGLLEKMVSVDKDFRFMATNDLMAELLKDSIKLDDDIERRVRHFYRLKNK